MLADAEEDILAFYSFPQPHWSKLRSTNPLERFNKEIGRRTDVVGIFPDDRSLIRLVGMLCLEQNDEWLVARRYLSAAAMEPLLEQRLHRDTTPDRHQREGPDAHGSLNEHAPPDERGRQLLHHVLGLDSNGLPGLAARITSREVATGGSAPNATPQSASCPRKRASRSRHR